MDSNSITNHEIWKRKLGKTATALLDTKAKKEKKLNRKGVLQTQNSGKSLFIIKSLYFL